MLQCRTRAPPRHAIGIEWRSEALQASLCGATPRRPRVPMVRTRQGRTGLGYPSEPASEVLFGPYYVSRVSGGMPRWRPENLPGLGTQGRRCGTSARRPCWSPVQCCLGEVTPGRGTANVLDWRGFNGLRVCCRTWLGSIPTVLEATARTGALHTVRPARQPSLDAETHVLTW